MKTLAFAKRTTKEIIRDPINLLFGLGFPIILILLLTTIRKNAPEALFDLNQLTPGIAVFGLSFISLFSATLISKDRSSSFLERLFTTPMKAKDYILGYTLPFVPMALLQTIICYLIAIILGLQFNTNLLIAIIAILPISLFFIAIGLLCGTIFNDKQVGGICGALLTNLTAWLSGAWFSLELVGGLFKDVADCLPFVHAVNLSKGLLNADYSNFLFDSIWVLGYGLIFFTLAIIIFRKKMKK